jgi:hypothetical protein
MFRAWKSENEETVINPKLIFHVPDFLALKIEAIWASETPVYFHCATRRCIPDDVHVLYHRCGKQKSVVTSFVDCTAEAKVRQPGT